MPREKSRREKIVQRAREAFENTREKSEKAIQDHPFTSVIIAAAIGALVAVGTTALLRKKRKTFRKRLRDYF